MPSAQPVPSAACAYERHLPSGESARCLLNSVKTFGVAMTVAPPATASVHSPRRRACTARCTPTSDDEQAVSTVTAGPSKPKV